MKKEKYMSNNFSRSTSLINRFSDVKCPLQKGQNDTCKIEIALNKCILLRNEIKGGVLSFILSLTTNNELSVNKYTFSCTSLNHIN